VVDLQDCDGPSGSDTLCTVAGSVGPRCEADRQQHCDDDGDCASDDRCVTMLHGPPQPLASGGVAVCIVSEIAEDVTGTLDLASGASALRVRDRARTFPGGSLTQPCPVCGGFCSGAAGAERPGARTLCDHDGDCADGARCVVEGVCSYGPNVDRPCRAGAPFGGPTVGFGTPSVDCPPGGSDIGVLDVLQDPITTGLAVLAPSHPCLDPGFADDACLDGVNAGRPCVVDAECPGGSCEPQCFCADSARPNECGPACVGGTTDGTPCAVDLDCPGGFCHAADCRADPFDGDSAQEGHCTTDPTRQCFVNGGIVRQGTPGVPTRVSAAVGCIPSSSEIGWPGLAAPYALTRPESVVVVGF
jgi:hypothetical protein